MPILAFNNPGVIIEKMPEDSFLKLKEELQRVRKEKNSAIAEARRNLQVLSIKEILYTPHLTELNSFINKMFSVWCKTFNQRFDSYKIGNVWTNYMRSGEFAPAHDHGSSIASFVIWVNIPYNRNDEESFHFEGESSYRPVLNKANYNGEFQFFYSNFLGKLCSHKIGLDKTYEGTAVMFPGDMQHMVYPFFSSDQERISVAGNINSVSHIPIKRS